MRILNLYGTRAIRQFRWIDYRPPKIAQLLLLIAALLHWLLPAMRLTIWKSEAPGIGLFGAGLAVMLWAWWLFRKHGTAICPTAKTDRLITEGIYRYSRNPMYLAATTMLLAAALYMGTLPFYLAAVVFWFIIDRAFCPYEENKLSSSFGRVYLDYRNRVRRWL